MQAEDAVEILEIRLATGDGHCLYTHPESIVLAFPSGTGTAKVYLSFNMETVFPPQQLQPDTADGDLILALFRSMLMADIGTVIDVTADIAEIAAAADLVTLTARSPQGAFQIAVSKYMVTAVAPAFDQESGDLAGANVFIRRVCMETNGRMLPVKETPQEVLDKLGWRAENAVGRQDGLLMTRPNRIIAPGSVQ